jgi:hypothetical protein
VDPKVVSALHFIPGGHRDRVTIRQLPKEQSFMGRYAGKCV